MLVQVHNQAQPARCSLCRADDAQAAGWIECACGVRVHANCVRELEIASCPALGCEEVLAEGLPAPQGTLMLGDMRFVAPEDATPEPVANHSELYPRSNYRPQNSVLSNLEFAVAGGSTLALCGLFLLACLTCSAYELTYAQWVMAEHHRLPGSVEFFSFVFLGFGIVGSVVGVTAYSVVHELRRNRGARASLVLSDWQQKLVFMTALLGLTVWVLITFLTA